MTDLANSYLKSNINDIVYSLFKYSFVFCSIIGLSLTKIAYYSTVSYRKALYEDDGLGNSGERAYKVYEGNRLHFVKFETQYIENCLDFVKENLVNVERFHGKSVKITGGGAYKYTSLLQEKLGLMWVTLLYVKIAYN